MRVLVPVFLFVAFDACAEIYKCVESGGRVTYSNVQSKDCARLNIGPPNSLAAPRTSVSPRGVSPSEFPRIDPGTQRNRDDERRRILDQELASEQAALAAARKTLSDQEVIVLPDERNVAGRGINNAKIEQRVQPFRDKIALHERNIEALRKEIANLR